jgi:LPXTG-site transpeptidase (sortase) family protein
MVSSAGRRDSGSLALHALGNVLIGVAIGLVGYYAVTNLFAASQQRSLRVDLPPSIASELPSAVTSETPRMDFEGWEEQDKAYWESLDEGKPFGRIVAPAMALDAVVVKGTERADLMKGPRWITYTDLPGPTGNCGISGHRTTYGAPFRQLNRLQPGDTVRFYSPYRVYTYRVKRVFSVRPSQTEVVASTKEPTLTMTACHPPYSARLRLIAQSELVSVSVLNESAAGK